MSAPEDGKAGLLAVAIRLRQLADNPRIYSNAALGTRLEEEAAKVTEWAHTFQALFASLTLTNDSLFTERNLPLRRIVWRRIRHKLRLFFEWLTLKVS